MGNAYPTPGLFGKFYDQDQDPLVEVVRDTVGRHDTFALACNAKYYEDMGYFGHVNCSDNFNGQLLPYTIAPRKGWPALNFFFNTAFDRQNLLVSRRAVVAARRLRAAARADRPRVPVERVPRRHRPGERVEPDRDPGARLSGEGAVLGGDRAPGDAGCRAEALEEDGVRPVHLAS